MDIYEVAQLVAFVLLVSVPLLSLDVAIRRSKHQHRRPGGRQ